MPTETMRGRVRGAARAGSEARERDVHRLASAKASERKGARRERREKGAREGKRGRGRREEEGGTKGGERREEGRREGKRRENPESMRGTSCWRTKGCASMSAASSELRSATARV
eukprot:3208176-Rhodomonas_salina.1